MALTKWQRAREPENVAIFDCKGRSRTAMSTRQFSLRLMVTCVLLARTVTTQEQSARKEEGSRLAGTRGQKGKVG